MGWLGTWAQRLKIAVDNTKIDDTLTWFPVYIHLSRSCGINSDHLEALFAALGSNYKRMAITKADGTTQLYVEVEEWDATNKEAHLHVSRDGWEIASNEDTTFYLYFDNSQDDNTEYVGDPNSEVAENVWDANFVLVDHLRDYGDTSHTVDSTSNDNDGTKFAANKPLEVSAKISNGQRFSSANTTYFTAPMGIHSGAGNVSMEIWWKPSTLDASNDHLVNLGESAVNKMMMFITQTSKLKWGYWGAAFTSNTGFGVGNWYHAAQTYDGANLRLYINGAEDGNSPQAYNLLNVTDLTLYVGQYRGGGAFYYEGDLDELRISSGIARSAAWVKASYETQRDNLLSFGDVEHRSLLLKVALSLLRRAIALTPKRRKTSLSLKRRKISLEVKSP